MGSWRPHGVLLRGRSDDGARDAGARAGGGQVGRCIGDAGAASVTGASERLAGGRVGA